MNVTVKLFAVVRERAGLTELSLDLPDGATVANAAEFLARHLPAAAQHLRHVAYAVNRSYAQPTTALHDGDELAVIPPVSGG